MTEQSPLERRSSPDGILEMVEHTHPRQIDALIENQFEASPERLCEDGIVVLENDRTIVMAVIDGATGLQSVTQTSLEGKTGRIAAEWSSASIQQTALEARNAEEIIVAANEFIAQQLQEQGTNPEVVSPVELSNASASIAHIDKLAGVISVAQLGDTIILVEKTDGTVELALPLDSDIYDDEALQLAKSIAQEQNIALPLAVKDPRVGAILEKSRSMNNAPDGKGSGVINGQSASRLYIQTRQYDIAAVKRITLLTDGMIVNNEAETHWQNIGQTVAQTGLKELYNQTLDTRKADADCKEYPRFKSYDDAAGVTIDIASLSQEAKRKYFNDVAQQHWPEMRLLLRGGKLTKKEGWRNVVEHCLVQVAAAEVVGEQLGLPVEELTKLEKVAAVHDWNKRLEKFPGQFTEQDNQFAQSLLDEVHPDTNLLHATGVDFIEKALVKNDSTFLERVQFYIDDICRGSDIVPLQQRLDEVEARRQDLNENQDLINRLGGKYWDKERELATQVEQEIFEHLQAQGVAIDRSENIPAYIKQQIQAKIRQYI